jgi:DNA-binding SARP family transcriptional activator
LLGFLLINQRTQITREKLIDTLWPDVILANGRASLSTALWRLRSIFEQLGVPAERCLKSSREWVAFDPEIPLTLDLYEFQEQLTAANETTDLTSRESYLRSAIKLYQGSFCEGIYTEWCLLERERQERSYLRALGQLMADLLQRQDYDEAIGVGQSIVQRDPLREEAHRAIMLCYWKLGRRTLGARQFQVCARLLQQELQIMPMPETISLYHRIIADHLSTAESLSAQSLAQQQALRGALEQYQDAADLLLGLLGTGEEQPEAAAAD